MFLTGYIDPIGKLENTCSSGFKMKYELFPFCCSSSNNTGQDKLEADFTKLKKNNQVTENKTEIKPERRSRKSKEK